MPAPNSAAMRATCIPLRSFQATTTLPTANENERHFDRMNRIDRMILSTISDLIFSSLAILVTYMDVGNADLVWNTDQPPFARVALLQPFQIM
jgi:hypothetical protein